MALTAAANGLNVPRREQLLEQLAAANRWGWGWVWLQVMLIVPLAYYVDWPRVLREPFSALFAIAMVLGPFAMSILRYWAQPKKEIAELKEQTRFGTFDKHQLRNLFQQTLRRLKLPESKLPVYIVADRFANATTMHVGLGRVFKWLNGIYLHRQALHKFTPEEVQDIMGHELGHFYRYYLVTERYRHVTLALGCLLGLLLVQAVGLNSWLSVLGLLVIASGIWKINGFQAARHIWCIEYLCDDLGAHVHGVAVSVAGLMKLGAEQELLTAVQQQRGQAVRSGRLTAVQLAEAISQSIPYGHATREEIDQAVHAALKRQAARGGSLGGFLSYVWNSERDAAADEEFAEQLQKLHKLSEVPRIPWEKLLDDPRSIKFDGRSLEQLVGLIESHPEAALFHIPEAIGQLDPTHPPLKQRILYLWQNRRAIEAEQAFGN